jgi:hypothetical protein
MGPNAVNPQSNPNRLLQRPLNTANSISPAACEKRSRIFLNSQAGFLRWLIFWCGPPRSAQRPFPIPNGEPTGLKWPWNRLVVIIRIRTGYFWNQMSNEKLVSVTVGHCVPPRNPQSPRWRPPLSSAPCCGAFILFAASFVVWRISTGVGVSAVRFAAVVCFRKRITRRRPFSTGTKGPSADLCNAVTKRTGPCSSGC